jgi:hypothetical protein
VTSLVDLVNGRTIGTVDSVAADKITIQLFDEAPHTTALNTGQPTGFPRINSYVLIPNETGATVAIVSFLRITPASYPKRKGMADFGLVDLPYPARSMTVVPIGTLVRDRDSDEPAATRVRRGVDVFPSVGDSVALPTASQLRSIVEGDSRDHEARIEIGTSPIAGATPVYVDPDKLFGRHLAVLGNTGAGKSCSVAGLVRWSLEHAARRRKTLRENAGSQPAGSAATTAGAFAQSPDVNARFIILDPNGEYSRAFQDMTVNRVAVEPMNGATQLEVPAWLWNGEEWAGFAGAAVGVQRPMLLEALRQLRAGLYAPATADALSLRSLRERLGKLDGVIAAREYEAWPNTNTVGQMLKQWGVSSPTASSTTIQQDLSSIATKCTTVSKNHLKQGKQDDWGAFGETALRSLADEMRTILARHPADPSALLVDDCPRKFDVSMVSSALRHAAQTSGVKEAPHLVDTLDLRIRGLLANDRLRAVISPTSAVDLADWLERYLGAGPPQHAITVIDLSLLPSEVIGIVVAVLSRIIFEALQRYRRHTASVLPTVLVLEEAHTFVHRDARHESASAASRECTKIIERIAREGRKFGLGLVISSQRPAELSETVLSQCNTFLLHRLVNERDQDLVRRLVPDGLGDVLRELPSLPSRRAVLLGWAAPSPVLVEMRELHENHRPKSPDPDFWKVWTGEQARHVDWKPIADEWQGKTPQDGGAQPPTTLATPD